MYRYMYHKKRMVFFVLCAGILLLFTACGPTVNQVKPQQTVVVSKSFQSQISPVPTIPAYRCGAWAANNAPGAYSLLTVYAKLTKNLLGVGNATASATAHFLNNDVTLDQQPVSDTGGYVMFSFALQGRQPRQTPTTVDVSFNIDGKTVQCSPAFFTPV